jgi:hypothetical protein
MRRVQKIRQNYDRGTAAREAGRRQKTHQQARSAHDETIAVVFDLVHPIRPGWRLGGAGGDARCNETVGAGRNHGLTYRLVRGTARASRELLCGAGRMGEKAWATSNATDQHSFG